MPCHLTWHGFCVVSRQDGLADNLQQPEAGVLVLGDQVEQPRDVVESLAVADGGVVVGEGAQDVVEGRLVAAGRRAVEVDVVGEGSGEVCPD